MKWSAKVGVKERLCPDVHPSEYIKNKQDSWLLAHLSYLISVHGLTDALVAKWENAHGHDPKSSENIYYKSLDIIAENRDYVWNGMLQKVHMGMMGQVVH